MRGLRYGKTRHHRRSRPSDWDHDQDGMPDWFEELTGTNPYDADNNEDPDGDGYTNLEDYLNWIAAPNYQARGKHRDQSLSMVCRLYPAFIHHRRGQPRHHRRRQTHGGPHRP